MCNHDQYDELDELELYECDEMFYKNPEKFLDAHSEDPTLTMERVKEIQKNNFDKTRDEQLIWFRNEVIDADKDQHIKFVFIVAHHALFSQGPHKVPLIFNQHIQPILRESNKIIAWFCGHNHALEHYIWNRQKNSNDNIQHTQLHQFLSGSGGRDLHDMRDAPVESQVDDVKLGYLGKEYGFISVHLQTRGINVAYWNEFSKLVYSYAVEYPK